MTWRNTWDNPSCIYVVIVTTAGPETYFKIGHTNKIAKRLTGIQTGCPLPIERVLFLPIKGSSNASGLEAQLHKRFRAFHTHGEWFLFDLSKPEHKAEFHLGCEEVIGLKSRGRDWQAYSVAEAKKVGLALEAEEHEKTMGRWHKREAAEKAARVQRIRSGLLPNFWKK